MNLDTFFEKFDLFADAPNAVAKMRELILDLAVRGKLVPQDPSEEDSQDGPLANLGQQMEIDKRGDLPEIPSSWHWMSLGDLGETNIGLTYSPQNINERGVPVLRSNNIQRGKIQFDDLVRVNVDIRDKCIISNGDLLICARNGSSALVGKSAIVSGLSEKTAFGAFMAVFRSNFNDYISIYLRSWLFRRTISSVSTTTINQITQSNLKSAQIPLPPLAEQKRIVAKVDELMALCDRLEAQQQQRETRHTALAQASLTRFADAPTPANLELLFHKSYDILPTDLRKTILTLAIEGKLVPHDPDDEPVDDHIDGISKTKHKAPKESSRRRASNLGLLLSGYTDAAPFELPHSWRWINLEMASELITKGSSPKWQGVSYVNKGEGILFITSENVGNYRLRKLDDLKYVEARFNEIEPRSILKSGDILINLVGASIGRTAIYDLHDGANINQAVALVRLLKDVNLLDETFLLHYLNSPLAIEIMMSSRVVTAQPNISLTDVREFLIPVPPLAEQKRIVAKVEQLMGLVDRLEAQLVESRAKATALLEAVVAELSAAA